MYVFLPSPISIHSFHSSSELHLPTALVHFTASSNGRWTVLAFRRLCGGGPWAGRQAAPCITCGHACGGGEGPRKEEEGWVKRG